MAIGLGAAMLGSAAIGGLGSIGGGILGGKASKKEAKKMRKEMAAAREQQKRFWEHGIGVSEEMYGKGTEQYRNALAQARAAGLSGFEGAQAAGQAGLGGALGELQGVPQHLQPYMQAGTGALNALTQRIAAGPGEFTEDPGYQFRLAEGIKARERGAAARGSQLSGAQQKALSRYGQDYASGEYGNFLDRYYRSLDPLAGVAGMGQQAAGQMTGVEQQNALARAGLQGQFGAGQMGLSERFGAGQQALEQAGGAGLLDAAQRRAALEMGGAQGFSGQGTQLAGMGMDAISRAGNEYDAWQQAAGNIGQTGMNALMAYGALRPGGPGTMQVQGPSSLNRLPGARYPGTVTAGGVEGAIAFPGIRANQLANIRNFPNY